MAGRVGRRGHDHAPRRLERRVLASRRSRAARRQRSVVVGGRSRTRPVQRLVRVLPALDDRPGDRTRNAARRDRPARLRRRDGLRRAVPTADPSDRRGQPQGRQQHHHRRTRRRRQPVGHRRPPRRASRARHGRRSSVRSATSAAYEASSWRSTSPSSARPIIRGSPSIPSGSPTAPTARSSTPRTRPRSTRTSTRSTSSRPIGKRCGRASPT